MGVNFERAASALDFVFLELDFLFWFLAGSVVVDFRFLALSNPFRDEVLLGLEVIHASELRKRILIYIYMARACGIFIFLGLWLFSQQILIMGHSLNDILIESQGLHFDAQVHKQLVSGFNIGVVAY